MRERRDGPTGLLLVYPQWQGAGALPELRDSALTLAPALAGARRRIDVDVPAGHALAVEAGIHGRGELLQHLSSAGRLLDVEQPSRVFAVGGDCGIEPAVIGYLNARHDGALAVLWLDAHPDLNTPETSPSGHFHGMPLRVLLGEGDAAFTQLVDRPLRPAQIVLAGMRAPDPPEQAFIEAHRIQTLPPASLVERPREILRWLRGTGLGRAYVHLDLDVLDPREIPCVACPTAGGIPVAALVRVLEEVSGEVELVGAGITEALLGADRVSRTLEPLVSWFRDV